MKTSTIFGRVLRPNTLNLLILSISTLALGMPIAAQTIRNTADTRVWMNDGESYSICRTDRQLRNANPKSTVIIEPATDAAMAAAADHVREEVFGREWNVSLPPLNSCDPEQMLTLIARTEGHAEPIAALTVMDTTADSEMHRRFGLPFKSGVRVARYTRLAVLRPYRGLDLPLRLILEGRRRFVAAADIGYTWLLFDAKRATSSSICSQLGSRASAQTFCTEYGLSQVLWRNESGPGAHLSGQNAQRFLSRSRCGCHGFAASTEACGLARSATTEATAAGPLLMQERAAICER